MHFIFYSLPHSSLLEAFQTPAIFLMSKSSERFKEDIIPLSIWIFQLISPLAMVYNSSSPMGGKLNNVVKCPAVWVAKPICSISGYVSSFFICLRVRPGKEVALILDLLCAIGCELFPDKSLRHWNRNPPRSLSVLNLDVFGSSAGQLFSVEARVIPPWLEGLL